MAPLNFWDSLENRKRFLHWVGKQLSIKNMEGWYGVSGTQVKNLGGRGLLSKEETNSIHKLLVTTYPDHEWLPWRFRKTEPRWFEQQDNRRMFFDWLGKRVGVVDKQDWEKVTAQTIRSSGGHYLLDMYNWDVHACLQDTYREYTFRKW
jgi:hypothetical protein